MSEEYNIAISETLDILKYLEKEDIDKISPEFMKFLEDNKSSNYIPNLDHTKSIKDMNLSKKTLGILGVIYRKFWCDSQQKEKFDKLLIKNQIEYEKKLREQYNPNNLFKNPKEHKSINKEKFELIEIKDEKWYKKLFLFIRNMFKK